MLTEYLPLPGDTPVIFWHPKVPKKLTIPTGVSGIGWQYALNMNTQPTFGGEVTQVLSSMIGPIQVHGQTRDAKQLRDIYSWFVYYMQIAGLRSRNEEYVIMEYPTRGWSFWIMPMQMPGFLINRDHIAVEWQMQAEIVADDASSYDVLEGHTMSGFYEASFDPHMFDIGFKGYDDPRNSTPISGEAGKRIGDNMQSLVGAWASGDFMHFAVDTGHKSGESQGLKSAQDYWSQILGGSDVISGGSGSGSQSVAGSYTGGEPKGKVQTAGAIASAFESAGIPGYLAVASSLVETGGSLDPDDRQNGGDSAMGLFQSFPTGAAGGQSHRSEVIKAFANPGQPVTKYWAATHQIQDAVGWWSDKKPVTNPPEAWAKRAQGAGDTQYAQKVAARIDEAKSLIKQYEASAGSAPSGGPDGWKGLARGGLKFAGPDQGLDFTGTGSLIAVGDGTVVKVDTASGWPGGTLIVLQLAHPVSRPAIGHTVKYVYYAEALTPQVKVNQKVKKGDVIATLDSSYPGSETGWAQDAAGSAFGTIHDGKPGGPTPTYGNDFGHFVSAL